MISADWTRTNIPSWYSGSLRWLIPPSLLHRMTAQTWLTVEGLQQAETLVAFGLQHDSRAIGICPGAEFGPAKQWPAEHYAELVNDLLAKGREVWFFGSSKDDLMVESILADVEPSMLARCKNLAGRTSLGQAIDLLAATEAVISNDSGLMHVAAALNKPVIAIYGSTTPDFTPPLADKVRLLATDVECRPCFGALSVWSPALPQRIAARTHY